LPFQNFWRNKIINICPSRISGETKPLTFTLSRISGETKPLTFAFPEFLEKQNY
jgi:hypothetical protein